MATADEVAGRSAANNFGRAFLEGVEAAMAVTREHDYDRATELARKYGVGLQEFIDVLKPPKR